MSLMEGTEDNAQQLLHLKFDYCWYGGTNMPASFVKCNNKKNEGYLIPWVYQAERCLN